MGQGIEYVIRIHGLLRGMIDKQEKRISFLEQESKMRQDTIACVDSAYDEACRLIEIQLHEIKKDISCLFTSLKGIETKLMSNPFPPLKPHKCPVCDGLGGFLSTKPNICAACAGKGIVWG